MASKLKCEVHLVEQEQGVTGVLKEIACAMVLWWEKGGTSGELRKVTRALRPREACVRWAGDMGKRPGRLEPCKALKEFSFIWGLPWWLRW